MLAIGFIRQFQEVYRDSETIVRSSRLWAATNFLLVIRFYVLFGLYVCFYLTVKEICSSYLDLKKNSFIRSVYIFDGLSYPQSRGSACKQQGEKSSLITILFSSTSLYYFENSARLKSLCANKSSVREGETDRKSRTAAAQSEFHRSYSRRNKQWNKPRSCLCGHWSERSISILL